MACGLAPRAAGSPRSERAGQAGVARGLAPYVELATLSGCELVALEIHDLVAGAGNESPSRPWLSRPCAARRADPPVPLAACLPGRRHVRLHRSATANCLRGRQRLDAPATADGRARPRLRTRSHGSAPVRPCRAHRAHAGGAGAMVSAFLDAVPAEAADARRYRPGRRSVSSRLATSGQQLRMTPVDRGTIERPLRRSCHSRPICSGS